MYFVYFSWWKDFRFSTSIPKVKVATAGKACGVWYEKLNTFQFKLPAGICAADMTFISQPQHIGDIRRDYIHLCGLELGLESSCFNPSQL